MIHPTVFGSEEQWYLFEGFGGDTVTFDMTLIDDFLYQVRCNENTMVAMPLLLNPLHKNDLYLNGCRVIQYADDSVWITGKIQSVHETLKGLRNDKS